MVRLKNLQERNDHFIKKHTHLFCHVCKREISRGREKYDIHPFMLTPLCEFCRTGTFMYTQENFSDDKKKRRRCRYRKPYEFMQELQTKVACLHLLHDRLKTEIYWQKLKGSK